MIPFFLLPLVSVTEAKPALSVLYFENQTGRADFDLLKKGIADMIVTDLVAWDGVTVVERQRLEQVLGELKLQSSKAVDPATRQKVGKLLGAKYILTGTFNASGNTFAIDAQVIEVQTGAVKVTARVSGAPDKVFDMEQELVSKVSAGIDARLRDAGQRRKVKVPSMDALLQYSKAIDLSDQGKLDEAEKAMQEVVSKSPTFLLAREQKKAILESLKESKERRRDITSSAVLELGKIAEDSIARVKDFDALDEQAQRTHLAMRQIRSRFLSRVLLRFLSTRDEHFHVILAGKEKDARQMMLTIAENHRRLREETDRHNRAHTKFYNGIAVPPSGSPNLDQHVQQLLVESKFEDVQLGADPAFAFCDFVLEGRTEGYWMGPALGDLDAELQKEAFDLLDRSFKNAVAEAVKANVQQRGRWEYDAERSVEAKANALVRLDRDEEAVKVLQLWLDAFPASERAERIEGEIEKMIGTKHDNERDKRERWAKALQGCDDMDIRVGMDTLDRKMRRMGIAGIAAQAKELESKCKPDKKNRSAFAYLYQHLGLAAARHEDCEAYRGWFAKYLELGGSVSDMKGYQKNYVPWCELGDVAKKVAWMYSKLDDHWEYELDAGHSSILSHDKKVLTLSAQKSSLKDRLTLRLEAAGPDGWKCTSARWQRRDGGELTGTCEVEITKLGKSEGDFDEGTYSAAFQEKEPYPHTMKLNNGQFRLPRR